MSTQDAANLESLGDEYHVIAELRARDDARTFIARRRSDGHDVLLVIARTPTGDEKNALTHYAADAKLLSGLEHRNVIPVLDSRWVTNDELMVATERVDAPTLAELISRGEQFSAPRTAAILQEVNGVLEWGREQKVVHRLVTPDTLHLEEGTDRVLVAFAVQPIPLVGPPGAEGDARTIATLASAMLATAAPIETDASPAERLDERPTEMMEALRPHLPQRIVEATDALLHPARTSTESPDVGGYIALVAMADALRVGEAEAARIRAEVAQEQRQARDTIEEERRAFEEEMAERRRRFEQEREQLERAVAKEREEMQRRAAEERAALEAERTEAERSVAEQRERLAEQRAEMERAAAAASEVLAAERAELERRAADIDRFRVDAEDFRREVEQYQRAVEHERSEVEERLRDLAGREATLARAAAVQRDAGERDRVREREQAMRAAREERRDDEETFARAPAMAIGPVAAAAGGDEATGDLADAEIDDRSLAARDVYEEPALVGAARDRNDWRANGGVWAAGAAVVGLVVIIAASALGVGSRERTPARADSAQPAAATMTPAEPATATRTAPAATVIDSAAGSVSGASVATRQPLGAPAAVVRSPVVDSAAAADSAARRAARIAARARADSIARVRARQRRDSAQAAQDMIFGPPPLAPAPTVTPRDSAARPRPDTTKPNPGTPR